MLPENQSCTCSHKKKLEIDGFITDSWSAFNFQPSQMLSMAIALVIPCERRLFEMFPEVIAVDTTNNTNNESRPLLIRAGKDSNGKMFTFLRAFLPNEKGWVFRWVFSVVLPKLFGNTILKCIQVIITDGDAQE